MALQGGLRGLRSGKAAIVAWFVALSLSGCYPELDWREISSAEGRFAVLLPGKPREAARSLNTAAGEVDMHMTATEAMGWQFGVAWADFPAAAVREPERLIDAQRDALLRNTAGRVLAEKPAPLGSRHGRLVVAEGRAGDTAVALHARFVVDGVRLYQVAATGAKGGVDQTGIETFLDSFKLTGR